MPVSKVRKSNSNKKGPTAPKERTLSVREQNKLRINEQAAQLQGALIHLRQMYDGAMAENTELKAGVTQRDYMLTALAVRYGNAGELTIPEEDIRAVAQGEYAGYNVINKDGIITIGAIDAESDVLYAEEEEEDDGLDGNEPDVVVASSRAANVAVDEEENDEE